MKSLFLSAAALMVSAIPAHAVTVVNVTMSAGGWRVNACWQTDPSCPFQTNLYDSYSFDLVVPDDLPYNQSWEYNFGDVSKDGVHQGFITRWADEQYSSNYAYFHKVDDQGSTWRITDKVRVNQVYPAPRPAVPEPATWMTMILGFGAIGYAMRRRTVARFV